MANLHGVPFRSSIIRIDTNQGLVGYGEVRDQASATYALMLKSRLVGENPCNVDKIFRKIKQFGHHGRQGGGVSGIEMALMDLAGKAYGVPAYALVGGRFRDASGATPTRRRCPTRTRWARGCWSASSADSRCSRWTSGIDLLWDVPGALIAPPGARDGPDDDAPVHRHPGHAKGVEHLATYVDTVRSIVGYDVALAADHFGHIALDSCIRIGRALEPFTLAWIEDLIPWQLTDQWRQLTEAVAVPTCTGEDIYLIEGFKPLLDAGAIRVVHPDPATSGGIAETKRLGDYAQERGIAMALHLAASPIATMACVHLAAATENFLALEHHAADVRVLERPGHRPAPAADPGRVHHGAGDPRPRASGTSTRSCSAGSSTRATRCSSPTRRDWDGESSHDRLWS